MSIFNAIAAFIASGIITLSRIAARTATVTGTGVDISSYTGPIMIVQDVGTVSGTTPTLAGKLQDSPDNSAWTDITGATFTSVTASDNTQAITIQADATAKYIRYVGTIGGTTPSFTMGVTAYGMKPVV